MLYKKILLIDDDEDDHEIFLNALERAAVLTQCITMSDAKEALIKLEAREITVDVIFLDLNMPVMSGIQFLKEIKKQDHLKHIPVIIYSTSSNAATIRQTKELGADDFITKPDKINELVDILADVIR